MARRFVVDLEGRCEEVKLPAAGAAQRRIKAAGRSPEQAARAAGVLWLNANPGASEVEVVVEDAS